MRVRILWTIEQAKKLAELRNDAVHSATFIACKTAISVDTEVSFEEAKTIVCYVSFSDDLSRKSL
ncbi:hypothetical protein HHL21_17345 [Massilia sp. RP-1-19]|uniref:Uncharacterized protein n=1 Tax=Massilia polaris TaxID=2728846 RepID=A0A848HRQ0_9BURK|nr:hypothetical protein [Massilia polaris]NML62810.1 hypothetical protein [Massilia polaris]